MSQILNSIAFIANILNIVLATGVFTLPFSLYEAGVVLGGVVLLLISLTSFITSSFLIESIAIANAINKEEQQIYSEIRTSITSENSMLVGSIHDVNMEGLLKFNSPLNSPTSSTTSEIEGKNKLNDTVDKDDEDERRDSFYIEKRFEVLKMTKSAFSKPYYLISIVIMIGYVYISITSNAVLMGTSLEQILIKTFDLKPLEDSKVGILYYIVVGFYYFCILTVSLRNIEELKKFTSIIMLARIVVIALIVGSCFYIIKKDGITPIDKIPKMNFDNITLMIGNTLFYFMIQHSVPGIVEGFKPQRNLMKLLFFSFFISFVVFYAYGIITLLTFGKYTNCSLDDFPSAIRNYFNLNFLGLSFVGYVINYYPIFNIITGSIQLITLKNNFVVAINGCKQNFSAKYEELRKVRI